MGVNGKLYFHVGVAAILCFSCKRVIKIDNSRGRLGPPMSTAQPNPAIPVTEQNPDDAVTTDQRKRHGRDEEHLLCNQVINYGCPDVVEMPTAVGLRKLQVTPPDLFPSQCSTYYRVDNPNFRRSVRYRGGFLSKVSTLVPGVNQVDCEHEALQETDENVSAWSKFVRTEIFNGDNKNKKKDNKFSDFASNSLNNCISGLHKSVVVTRTDGSVVEQGRGVVDFSYHGWRPMTADDVIKGLFDPGSHGVRDVKNGKYGEACAQVIKMVLNVTGGREATDEHFVKGVYDWRDAHQLPFTMGDKPVSGRWLNRHGLVNIARRMACNSFETRVRRKILDKWGIDFKRNRKAVGDSGPEAGCLVIDVQKFLPESIQDRFKDRIVIKLVKSTRGEKKEDLAGDAKSYFENVIAEMRGRGLPNSKVRSIFNTVLGSYEADIASGKLPARPRLPTEKGKRKGGDKASVQSKKKTGTTDRQSKKTPGEVVPAPGKKKRAASADRQRKKTGEEVIPKKN